MEVLAGHGKENGRVKERRSVKEMWTSYIAKRNDVDKASAVYEAWHFCDNEADANELAASPLAHLQTGNGRVGERTQ